MYIDGEVCSSANRYATQWIDIHVDEHILIPRGNFLYILSGPQRSDILKSIGAIQENVEASLKRLTFEDTTEMNDLIKQHELQHNAEERNGQRLHRWKNDDVTITTTKNPFENDGDAGNVAISGNRASLKAVFIRLAYFNSDVEYEKRDASGNSFL